MSNTGQLLSVKQNTMTLCRRVIAIVFILTSVLFGACSSDEEPDSRAFRMGFATVPYGSPDAMSYAFQKLSVESDIVNHYFDTGVPWVEALSGDVFPEHIMEDWTFRKDLIKTAHKSYVSVTPINYSHDGLAFYRGTEDNLPLPAPWDRYSFGDDAVKTAYVNYCKRIIDFFEPDYFAMSIEANLLHKFRPETWPEYLGFHAYVYREIKAHYPGLPVFTTVAGAPLLKDFLPANDHVLQRLAAMQLLEMSDYYAIAFYPPLAIFQTGAWPTNTFDDLFSLSTKPVIIAETACTAVGLPDEGHSNPGLLIHASDPVKQKLFVDALLSASDKWKAEFVIWLTLREEHPANTMWASNQAGFYDENGNPRPALNSWREWFHKRISN